jgi:sugar phosphate isomerase/epimerase
MYLEVITQLPGEDGGRFELTVKAAREAGALCLRSACLSGRRYEAFARFEDWKKFVVDSKTRMARAVPILEKYRMPMGIENHKDWTAEEQEAFFREHGSEYLGVCLDTGNNIALLDDPYELVERLAPYVICTHIKDMAVDEYTDGFLISEVPLGEGMLDMKRILETIAKGRRGTRFTLEMITRDPLKVPCLDEKYWVTFPHRNGVYLARTLAMVRKHKPPNPLPSPEKLDRDARLRAEEDNVKRCLAYAREQLGLRAEQPASSAHPIQSSKRADRHIAPFPI